MGPRVRVLSILGPNQLESNMRDGIADYELRSMLGERNPRAAERVVAKHVLDFDRYNCGVKTFRATRRELLELLSGR